MINWVPEARKLADAPATASFSELVKLSGLNPFADLRFADWSNISFDNCDLRHYDFTGSRMLNCSMAGALISGARFDQVELSQSATEGRACEIFKTATDWRTWLAGWQLPDQYHTDAHLRSGAIFQDAPFSPEMTVVDGPRSYHSEDEDASSPKKRFAISTHPVSDFEWQIHSTDLSSIHEIKTIRSNEVKSFISWHNALRYTAWLCRKTRKNYRLPTMAEWELVVDHAPPPTHRLNKYGIFTPNSQEWVLDHSEPNSTSSKTHIVRGCAHFSEFNTRFPNDSWILSHHEPLYSGRRICFRVVRDIEDDLHLYAQ